MITFSDTERPITAEQLLEMEIYIGIQFPQGYKQHLLLYNGGRCEPCVFSFHEADGRFNRSCVDWFLAIYDGKHDNFKNDLDTYKVDEKRMPASVFPIANDPGGNAICIDANDGKVYFWDHEMEVDYTVADDTDYSNLYLIANSFQEFLDGLQPLEEDEEEGE